DVERAVRSERTAMRKVHQVRDRIRNRASALCAAGVVAKADGDLECGVAVGIACRGHYDKLAVDQFGFAVAVEPVPILDRGFPGRHGENLTIVIPRDHAGFAYFSRKSLIGLSRETATASDLPESESSVFESLRGPLR